MTLPVSLVGSLDEEGPMEGTSSGSTRFKLSLEEVENLLAAIYKTLDIKEDLVEQSRHDLMY